MALKYYIEYNDVYNVPHRFEIYDDTFSDPEIEVFGSVELSYASTDNPLEQIKGCGLRVNLEADSTLTFSDLYSEEQRTFKVIYYRDSDIKFNGWLNPEGWYEDFVNENWVVSFDCIDGLSLLKDLSYVEDATGLPFTGKQTQLEVISNCLLRTGIQQNINTDIDIVYTGLSTSLNVLANTKVLAARFIKDDNDTYMDCEEVLQSILKPYAACLTSRDGEWFIYKPNQLFTSATMTYFRYNYLGVALSPTTATLDTSISLGSEINSFYPHHASSNQRKSIENSIGAYRINYKYGLVKSYYENKYLYVDTGPDIGDWNIIGSVTVSPGSNGISMNVVAETTSTLQLQSDLVTLDAAIPLNIDLLLQPNQALYKTTIFYYSLTLIDGGTTYYMASNGSWTTTSTILEVGFSTSSTIAKRLVKMSEATPVAGDVRINIYSPEQVGIFSAEGDAIQIIEASLSKEGDGGGLVKGEFHTFQRTDKPSAKVKDTIEVSVGDNNTDTYLGTFYKADGVTPTETWNRIGKTESLPILGIMGEETLRLSASPAIVFSGDIYGFFDYLSTFTIDGVDGTYILLDYTYNTINNLINCKFICIFGNELTDIDYKITLDYGNVVKPTIKG